MTTLAEVRERDARMDQPGEQEFAAVAFIDRRFLLSQLDALRACYGGLLTTGNKILAERDALQDENFTLNRTCSQLGAELDALKAAVKAAGPALEAGIALCVQRCLVHLPSEETAEWSAHAAQLRALVGLVK